MPVVTFPPDRLKRLLGKDIPDAELLDTIPMLGADLGETGPDEWSIEFFPDRPDLFTVEGLARALRAYLGIEPGLRTYEMAEPTTHVDVDPGLADVRPHIACAWVRGVDLDEEALTALMAVQEDLHWGLGARRSRVAIGVHDAAPLEPPFSYEAVDPDGVLFTPLVGMREREAMDREMTPAEVLADHPKGREYAHVLEGKEKVPIIFDANRSVLSFPPIINGSLTTLTTSTTDLFIDTTGTDLKTLDRVLNILVTSLAEAGGTLEQVEVRAPEGARATPDLAPDVRTLDVDRANALLGTDLDADGTARALRRMGYGAEPADDAGGDSDAGSGTGGGPAVEVQVPAFRSDILHPWDLVEDVAIGVGFDALEPALPAHPTTGRELAWQTVQRRVRHVLVGLGFLEAMTLTLTDERVAYEKTRRPVPDAGVRLANPVTEEQTRARDALLPSLLHLLSLNTHRDLPQSLFETGDVLRPDATNERRVAFVRAAARTGFTEAKGLAQALVEDALDAAFDVQPAEDPLFVEGRCAAVLVDGDEAGLVGEVHPEVLEAFELKVPVVGLELTLP